MVLTDGAEAIVLMEFPKPFGVLMVGSIDVLSKVSECDSNLVKIMVSTIVCPVVSHLKIQTSCSLSSS